MAEIKLRPNSSVYQGEFRIKGRRVRFSTGCKDRKAAQRAADAREAEEHKRLNDAAGYRFSEVAVLYFARDDLAASTVKGYERNMGHILQTLGDFYFRSLEVKDIRGHVAARLMEGCGRVTLRREVAFLQAVVEFAMELDDELTVNVVKMIKKNKLIGDARKRDRYTSKDEFQRLYDACSSELYKNILVIAVDTGMRVNEMLKLHMRDVDLERGFASLKPLRVKTKRSREIPLSPRALTAFRGQRDYFVRYYAERPWTQSGSHMTPPLNRDWSGHFFENPHTGKPLTSVKNWWRKLRDDCGVEDLKMHDLRHTFATWGLQAGADETSLMSITGHQNRQSFDRYAHASIESRKLAIAKLTGHTSDTGAVDNLDTPK